MFYTAKEQFQRSSKIILGTIKHVYSKFEYKNNVCIISDIS